MSGEFHQVCFCLSIVGFVVTYAVFFAHGVPLLRKYLQEERHHISKTCALKSIEDSETRSCSYRYWTYCRNRRLDCRFDEVRHGRYVCWKVVVSYEDENKSMVKAQLFRSFRDAKHTDYQCAVYECQHSGKILTYGENLKKMDNVKCFTNPNKPQYVYMESSADNSGWNGPVFSFSLELIFVVVMTLGLTYPVRRCCIKLRPKRNKTIAEAENNEKVIPLNSNLP